MLKGNAVLGMPVLSRQDGQKIGSTRDIVIAKDHSRIVAFSTGNVYPLVPVDSGGATEETPTGPVGEYAQSALGRERRVGQIANQLLSKMILRGRL